MEEDGKKSSWNTDTNWQDEISWGGGAFLSLLALSSGNSQTPSDLKQSLPLPLDDSLQIGNKE